MCSLPQWAAPGAIPYGATATGSDSRPKTSLPPRRIFGVANEYFFAALAPPASEPAATAPAPITPALASRSRRLSPFPSLGIGRFVCHVVPLLLVFGSTRRRDAVPGFLHYDVHPAREVCSRYRIAGRAPTPGSLRKRLQESIVGSVMDRADVKGAGASRGQSRSRSMQRAAPPRRRAARSPGGARPGADAPGRSGRARRSAPRSSSRRAGSPRRAAGSRSSRSCSRARRCRAKGERERISSPLSKNSSAFSPATTTSPMRIACTKRSQVRGARAPSPRRAAAPSPPPSRPRAPPTPARRRALPLARGSAAGRRGSPRPRRARAGRRSRARPCSSAAASVSCSRRPRRAPTA